MRFILAFLIAVALWAQDTGSVEGTVVNSVTGVGISGATVYLISGTHYETVTDGAGTFQFSGIKPGDYFVHVEKSLFTPPPATNGPPPRIHVESGADRNIIGQTMKINGERYTVVGVLQPGLTDRWDPEAIIPLSFKPEELNDHAARWWVVSARLKPRITVQQAQAEMDAIAAQEAKYFPKTN